MIKAWENVELDNLHNIADEIRSLIKKPSFLLLTGDVGAGKTTFTKSFVEASDTLSPTYSIMSESKNILHADFYRISDYSEIAYLELDLYIEGKDYFFLEWGRQYLPILNRYIPDYFSKYELIITMHGSNRNYSLFSI